MTILPFVIGPHPDLSRVAEPVARVDDQMRAQIADLFETLRAAQGLGLAAPMCGIQARIIILDLECGARAYINPVLAWQSDETQEFEEASLCYPGIAARVRRPAAIRVRYLDEEGVPQEEEASGWRATVIQHELDYLDGRVYLDHLKPLKRRMVLEKYAKLRRAKR